MTFKYVEYVFAYEVTAFEMTNQLSWNLKAIQMLTCWNFDLDFEYVQ